MPRIALSDLKIRALKSDRQQDFWDSKTPGFGIRISTRSKTFIANRGGTRKTLGHYPAISLQEARRRFFALKALSDTGNLQISFHQARSEYLAQDRWKPRTRKEVIRILMRHFHWDKPLDRITPADVAAAIAIISAPKQAAQTLAHIKAFFNWCVPRYLKHSPARGIKPPARPTPRQRLLSMDELAAIWRAAETMGQYGRQVQLLILTGQRCNQFLQDYSVRDGTITFPPASMKNNRSHTIPLGNLATSLLGGTPVPYRSENKRNLDRLSGISGWTLHDIRRAFASGMASLGITLPVIERLLAHRSGSFAGIVGVYQHYSYEKEMRAAIEAWDDYVLKIASV
jgi:integrase